MITNFDSFFNDLPEELETNNKVAAYKFLKLYAYNAYFNADDINTEEVNKGCAFIGKEKKSVDGVYINNSTEDTTVECLYVYYLEDNDTFNVEFLENVLEQIKKEIDEIRKRQFSGFNKKAEELFGDYFDPNNEEKINNINIRIITNYDPEDLKEKSAITKRICDYNAAVKGFEVTTTIDFAKDVINVINSNKAPFDFVTKAKLAVDDSSNYLKYSDNSIICNISASSLRNLWAEEGNRGLLAMNLRYYIKSKQVDSKIEESIKEDYNNFWYLNNGIIIVCNDFELKNNTLYLSEFSIVNGGQTTRMIGETPFEKDFYIACKVIKNCFETNNEKNYFVSKVAEASNTQKAIKIKDIIANRVEQRNLKSLMADNNIFIEIKRGDKCNKEKYKESWQRTKNNELAQDIYSFVFMLPGPARNSVSKILENQNKYDRIFKNHSFSFEFYKDLLFLDKSIHEYQKKVDKSSEEEYDAITRGLVKNGMYYCLAVIGYILKFKYNRAFEDKIVEVRNNENQFALYSEEKAFDNSFIGDNISYNDFKKDAFKLYDHIFRVYLREQFLVDKEKTPTLAYSNWTKNNQGFVKIKQTINFRLYDVEKTDEIEFVQKMFAPITKEQEEKNIKEYEELCIRAIEAKTDSDENSTGLTGNDKDLYDELLVYRLNYSKTRHISEKNVYGDATALKLAKDKPHTKIELKKYLSDKSFYYCADDLLNIINKYY